MANDVVLPDGAECNQCNKRLGRIESALLIHNRIWVPIIYNGIKGKGGRARKSMGTMARNADGELTIRVEVPVSAIPQVASGTLHIHDENPVSLDDHGFRRALHVIGLRYLALKRGATHALDGRFDEARRYARSARRGDAWPYVQVVHPESEGISGIRLFFPEPESETIVGLRLFADEFYVALERAVDLGGWALSALGPDAAIV